MIYFGLIRRANESAIWILEPFGRTREMETALRQMAKHPRCLRMEWILSKLFFSNYGRLFITLERQLIQYIRFPCWWLNQFFYCGRIESTVKSPINRSGNPSKVFLYVCCDLSGNQTKVLLPRGGNFVFHRSFQHLINQHTSSCNAP